MTFAASTGAFRDGKFQKQWVLIAESTFQEAGFRMAGTEAWSHLRSVVWRMLAGAEQSD
jgi:hypothetical protein